MIPGNSEEDIRFEEFVDENLKRLAENWVDEKFDAINYVVNKIIDDPEEAFDGRFWKYLLENYEKE